MSDHSPTKAVSETKRAVAPTTTLKHVRAAALAVALVPLAQVVATPVTVSAQDDGLGGSAPAVPVPEGGSIWPMAAAGAVLIEYQRRKKKQ